MYILLYLFLTLLSIPVLFVLGYLLAAYLLKQVVVNRGAEAPEEGVEVYVFSNGAHTDICFPVKNPYEDWTAFIDPSLFESKGLEYIAFGWGDKGFYFDTPTWAELKLSTGLKAVFSLSESTIHAVYYADKSFAQEKYFQSMVVNQEQYRILSNYVKESFDYDREGNIIPIDFAGLPAYEHLNDHFYEAKGRYHFFKTCNCWVNTALKKAGIRTAYWTPFADAVFYQLQKNEAKQEAFSGSKSN